MTYIAYIKQDRCKNAKEYPLKTTVPYLETCDKWWDFSEKLNDAYIQVLNELGDIRIKIQKRAMQEFLTDDLILPEPEELNPKASLLLPKAAREANSSENVP